MTTNPAGANPQVTLPATVLLLHGWFCDAGRKEAYLRSLGFVVVKPKLSDWSFRRAVRAARKAYEQCRPDVIIGSSRGGAIAMNFDSGRTPLILMCPAFRHFGRARRLDKTAVVIHGRRDRWLRVSGSDKLCRNSSDATLLIVDDGHRLRKPESRQALHRGLEIVLRPTAGSAAGK
jgi:pimeloyl-ACP methyl ester carboxylesterase